MTIHDWPEASRPRERMIKLGAEALTDAELLAIFLRVGVRGKTAVDLAEDLLQAFNRRIEKLMHATLDELSAIPGMGPAKGLQLQATLELARRALTQSMLDRDLLGSPQAVRDYLRLRFSHQEHESFTALWLDTRNRLIACDEMFQGTLTQASVYPREVVKKALSRNAAGVIIAHNHPSGIRDPSSADETLTLTLKQALALVDVRLLDHFIVAGTSPPYSFAEAGKL